MKRLSLLLICLLAWMTCAQAVSVSLTWDYQDNALEPAVSFNVYRDTDCLGVFTSIGTTPRNLLTFTDVDDVASPFLDGHRYCYEVTAIGADGKESAPSNGVSFLVPLPQPAPNAPSGLRGVFIP